MFERANTRLENGPIPLYHQLERDLRARINSGEYAPGQALPKEEDICKEYGVSRITVRRALDALINQRLIIKRRGVGSFVAVRESDVRSVRLVGSLDEFLATAGRLQSQVLSLMTMDPPPEVITTLGLAANQQAVQLVLVSSLESHKVAYLEIYFPPDIGAAVDIQDVADGAPIIQIVERKLNLRVARAEQVIEGGEAGSVAAGHLGLQPHSPVLRIRRVYYTAADRPIEAAFVRYHPDHYRYSIEFRAEAASRR